MLRIKIEAPMLKVAQGRVQDLSRRFRTNFLGASVKDLQRESVRLMDNEAPYGKRDSGDKRLRGSHKAEMQGDLGFSVVSDSPHAQFVIEGTRRHFIWPGQMSVRIIGHTRSTSPKKALYWPGLGHPVSYVGPPYTALHPGTKPNNYPLRAAFKLDAVADKIFNVLGAKIQTFLGGR